MDGVTKDALRREMRRRLRDASAEARADAQEAIERRVWTVPEVARARTLLLFADLPEEVETGAVAAAARRRGIAVCYPRTVPDAREMTLHRVRGVDELVAGNYGIREPDPARCVAVAEAEIDAVLVPGLAWDRHGNRLGRGAGYYDRLFARPEWRGFRCGIFFAFQEAEAVPADRWDLPLDAVVTDREVWRAEADGGAEAGQSE